jgi:hypothetical protein
VLNLQRDCINLGICLSNFEECEAILSPDSVYSQFLSKNGFKDDLQKDKFHIKLAKIATEAGRTERAKEYLQTVTK